MESVSNGSLAVVVVPSLTENFRAGLQPESIIEDLASNQFHMQHGRNGSSSASYDVFLTL
jgi:hypothetical protein